MQCEFGIEVLVEEIAEQLGLDVVAFKRANWLKLGEPMYLSKALGEGREGFEQRLESNGLEQCVAVGLEAGGHGPEHLALVEHVDVVVGHGDVLVAHMRRRRAPDRIGRLFGQGLSNEAEPR